MWSTYNHWFPVSGFQFASSSLFFPPCSAHWCTWLEEMKTWASSSQLVAVQVGMVVAAMVVGPVGYIHVLLFPTLHCYKNRCSLPNHQLLHVKGVLLWQQPVEHSSVFVPLMELFCLWNNKMIVQRVVNPYDQICNIHFCFVHFDTKYIFPIIIYLAKFKSNTNTRTHIFWPFFHTGLNNFNNLTLSEENCTLWGVRAEV